MKRIIIKSLPLIILLLAVGLYAFMQVTAAQPETKPIPEKEVSVSYVVAQAQTVTMHVLTRGTVEPSIQTDLTAEVTGRIISVAPEFHVGGTFRKGDLMLEIESHDHQAAVIQARAVMAQARLNLAAEQAQARQARRDWNELSMGKPTDLALRRPQLAQAQAEVAAGQANLAKAERDLARTQITAPYDLMVQSKQADPNQYVMPGTPLARVFALEAAHIRLPLTEDQLSRIDVPALGIRASQPNSGLPVLLTAFIAGRRQDWKGHILHAENIYDPKSRVTHVVASVEDPYAMAADGQLPSLAVGMFVQAQIQGRRITDAIILPINTWIDGSTVWVIREDNTLQQRQVNLLYSDSRHIVIDSGLAAGEKVCSNVLFDAFDGMSVTPAPANGMALATREAP